MHIVSALKCFHCGEICPNDTIRLNAKYFCCNGCLRVFDLLSTHALTSYYTCDINPGKKPSKHNFDYLNEPSFYNRIVSFSRNGVSKAVFYLPSIHCRSCLYLLENLTKINPNIVKSTLNFGKKIVTIWFKEENIRIGEMASLLALLGYEPLISTDEETDKKSTVTAQQTKLLIQLGVAGFCAGNSMLFSFPEYLGIDDAGLKHLFGNLNIGLGTLTVFYSGQDYFKNVWSHIRLRKITIELPILIGILVGYFRSLYEIFSHTGAGYIDSVSGLLFFLLIGKWFQQKSFDFLSFERSYKAYFPLVVSKILAGEEVQIPLSDILIGDHVYIRNQEIIPADAVITRGESQLDYSFVTGESTWEEKVVGNSIYAGGRHHGEIIEIEITKSLDQSHLTQLWEQQPFKNSYQKSENWENFANKVGVYFTIGLMSLALIVGIYWFIVEPSKWVNACVSILVIACPCALAISYPFTLGHGIRWLAKLNFFVKDIHSFERLAQIDTIVFDKTGTLTVHENKEPSLHLSRALSAEEWSILLTMSNQSTHPLSRQLKKYILFLGGKYVITQIHVKEFVGKGIEALYGGIVYRIGHAKFTGNIAHKDAGFIQSETQLYISIANQAIGHFEFPWLHREGIEHMLSQLKKSYQIYLLSGDKESNAGTLLDWFSDPSTCRFECSPMDKMNFILDLQKQGKKVMMVGDGLNDAGALKQAEMGIAVSNDHLHFTPSSDAILQGDQIMHLPAFLTFAHNGMTLIKLSFGLSLIYNAIGLSFAIQGNLSPMIAAILMPINSISMLVIANVGMNWKGKQLNHKNKR